MVLANFFISEASSNDESPDSQVARLQPVREFLWVPGGTRGRVTTARREEADPQSSWRFGNQSGGGVPGACALSNPAEGHATHFYHILHQRGGSPFRADRILTDLMGRPEPCAPLPAL